MLPCLNWLLPNVDCCNKHSTLFLLFVVSFVKYLKIFLSISLNTEYFLHLGIPANTFKLHDSSGNGCLFIKKEKKNP